jgi:hypothetical protein
MNHAAPVTRGGEYAVRGDDHRAPDPDWHAYPTHLAKLEHAHRKIDRPPPAARVGLAWRHRWLTRLLPVPGWCFLRLFEKAH